MKKSRMLAAAALVAGLGAALPAMAAPTTVSITGGSWLLGSGWGAACAASGCDPTHSFLNVSWGIAPTLAGTSFQLGGAGQSQTVQFGWGLMAEEDDQIAAGEVDGLGLSAWLELGSPLAGGSGSVAQVTASVGPLKDQGSNVDLAVVFQPVMLSLAGGGELRIDLSPLSWNCQGNGACVFDPNKPQGTQGVSATFTLVKAAEVAALDVASPPLAPAAVPEPSSLLLLGIGLAGLGLRRRSKA